MESDVELERKYRNKVMLISSMLFIYSISGGQFMPEIGLWGSKVIFNSPENIVHAIAIIMIYFWWRHFQLSTKVRHEVKIQAYATMVIPIWMREVIRDKGAKNGCVLHEPINSYPVGFEATYEEKLPGEDYISLGANWFGLCNIYLWVTYSNRYNPNDITSYEMYLKNLQERVSFVFIYWCSFVKNAFFKPNFADAILPSIVMLISLTSYLYNLITHGFSVI
ncbi:hypothetical protein [Aeromonas enteropelogenes]|uniref:hypothetical protein n=1 Tax=Aeromonas enteropelogenes TaxID=29489 RepID=UPI003BA0F049